MKRINKFLIVVVLCIILIGAIIPFTLINFSSKTPSQSGHVNIYVNSTIYSSMSSDVTQYKQDIIRGFRF